MLLLLKAFSSLIPKLLTLEPIPKSVGEVRIVEEMIGVTTKKIKIIVRRKPPLFKINKFIVQISSGLNYSCII